VLGAAVIELGATMAFAEEQLILSEPKAFAGRNPPVARKSDSAVM
jgi:hypothetical protein